MKTVFFDVDTQIDFISAAGALRVPGAGGIVKNLGALTRFAASNAFPVLSTADAHTEDDPEFKSWRPHCVAGTAGQLKISATLFAKPLVLTTAEGALDWVADTVGAPGQIVIEKQHIDCFTNPNLRPLLDLLQADRFVVYGVVSEICVQAAAFGLLQTVARVEIVTDAIRSLAPDAERQMLQRFVAQGGALTTTAQVIGK
jgi:nicotinamidase/pyrazinamidase